MKTVQNRSGKTTSLRACFLTATLLAALLMGCAQETEMEIPALKEPVSVNVDTYQVVREEIYEIETFDGEIIPLTTQVVAEYSGLLGKLLVKEGDQVEAGQLIAQLSDVAVRTQLEALEKTMEQTEEQNRLNNEIVQYDIELLKLDLAEARAAKAAEDQIQDLEFRLEETELSLRQQKEKQELAMGRLEEQKTALEEQIVDCDILAPASGRVAYVGNVKEGGMLLEGTVVAVIASEEDLQVRTDFLPDGTFRKMDSCHIYYGGQEIEIQNLPYERSDYVAAVLRNGSFYTYFNLSEQPAEMKAGDYAQIRVIKNLVEDALTIPVTALYRDGSSSYVYVIDEAGSRIKVPVATGVRNEIMVEITDGLMEGDEVYVKN